MKTIYTDTDELKLNTYVSQSYDDGLGVDYKTYYKVILRKNDAVVLECVGSSKKGVENHEFMIINGKQDLGYAMLSPISEKEVMIDIL